MRAPVDGAEIELLLQARDAGVRIGGITRAAADPRQAGRQVGDEKDAAKIGSRPPAPPPRSARAPRGVRTPRRRRRNVRPRARAAPCRPARHRPAR